MANPVTCIICKRERTSVDIDYNPTQIIYRQPSGWYSGDDGEICGHDMDLIIERQ